MKIDVTEDFYLDILLCIATHNKGVKISEYNSLINEANALISANFPNSISVNTDRVVKTICAFEAEGPNVSTLFLQSLAKKMPSIYEKIARDQTKSYRDRIYKIRYPETVLKIADLNKIDYTGIPFEKLI
jgi:hypothetical protein